MSQQSLNLLVFLALLLFVSSEAVYSRLPPDVGLPNPDGLTRLFFSSRLTHRDPKTSMSCFAGYIGESNLIAQQYSDAYGRCMDEAKHMRVGVDKEFVARRQRISRTAENVCQALRHCDGNKDTLDSFNCHAAVGSNNTRSTYSISGNASESATMLQERYHVIDLQHDKCNNNAEQRYVSSTANNYNYLHECLDGRIKPKPVPTTSTSSTTTTTTTTTTTEAPTTTTSTAESLTSTSDYEDQFKQLLNLLN